MDNGGAGALVVRPGGELRAPALFQLPGRDGGIGHSTRLAAGPPGGWPGRPVVLCADSQSALSGLRAGPAAQQSRLGANIWQALLTLVERGRRAHLQWVPLPSHCGLEGNERADTLTKEAAQLPQESVPLDVRTVHRAAARTALERATARWPAGWYRGLMGSPPPPPAGGRLGSNEGGRRPPVTSRSLVGVGPVLTCTGSDRTAAGAATNAVASGARRRGVSAVNRRRTHRGTSWRAARP